MQPALAPAPHPSMQSSAQDTADRDVYDLLQNAQQSQMPHAAPSRPQVPASQSPPMQPNAPGPRDQTNIDPAISGTAMLGGPPATPPPGEPDDDESPKSYGKRALSTSKRAAQNRAAQRAFRQRKESYIRRLEDRVKEFENVSDNYKALQSENYQLREYIINLQSRLLDSQGEVPELPGNIDLSQPRPEMPVPPPGTATATGSAPAPATAAAQQQPPHQAAPGSNDDMNSLNRIAVAGLGMRKHPNEDAANYMGNNFPAKRMRHDGSQPDSSEGPKVEAAHGLPMS